MTKDEINDEFRSLAQALAEESLSDHDQDLWLMHLIRRARKIIAADLAKDNT